MASHTLKIDPLELPLPLITGRTDIERRNREALSGTLLILIVLFLSLPGITFSQPFQYRHIGMSEGLPGIRIRDIILDSRGFYWIGTEAGLVRWYGERIKIHGMEQGLPSLNVSAIAEDGNGDIWLGLPGTGIVRYNGIEFILEIPQDSLPGARINQISYSRIWDVLMVGTDDGFTVYRNNEYRNYRPEPFSHPPMYANITGFLETDSYIYVQSFNNGLFNYYPDKDSIALARVTDRQMNFTLSSFITEKSDTIWALAYSNNIVRKGKDRVIIEGTAEILDITEDGEGNVYLAGTNGPFSEYGGLLRMRGDSLELLNPLYGLPADRINRVIYDKSDQIIVVSDQGLGLFVLNPGIFKTEFDGLPPSQTINIRAFASSDNGVLWLLDEKEIYFKKPGGSFERFDRGLIEREFDIFKKEIFPEKYSFFLDPDGSWEKYESLRDTGSYPWENPYCQKTNNEVAIIDNGALYSPAEYIHKKSVAVDHFSDIKPGPDNSVMVLSNAGVFQISAEHDVSFTGYFNLMHERLEVLESNKIVTYSPHNLIFAEFRGCGTSFHKLLPKSTVSVTDLIKTSQGTWFSCLNNGLYRVEENDLRLLNEENTGLHSSITTLAEDHRGNLITGNNNASIQILRFENDSIEVLFTISPQDNITGDRITWMEVDGRGFLWAGTNLGTNRIDLNRLYNEHFTAVRFFNQEDGMHETNIRASHSGNKGNIWIGGSGTVAEISTDAANQLVPGPRKVFISRIDLNHQQPGWEEIRETDPWTGVPVSGLKLSHGQNSLSFYFSTANIAGQGKTLYRYRMIGMNEHWSPFDPARQVIYPNLAPGRYLLEVESQLAFDPGSRGKTEFAFRILPPWWQTWWFYITLGVSLLAVFWLILILRVRYVRNLENRKLIHEREISELRIKALQAQMNPHFTFNAINSIQYYILNKEQDSAFIFIGYFSKLIRQTLEFASRSSVSITEETDFLENYIKLEMMRFENKFVYETEMADNLNNHRCRIPPMLLQPFVENAILHGLLHKEKQGILKIKFAISEGKTLQCVVEDNGIGREKSAEINRLRHKQHNSMGLDISRRRVGLLNEPGKNDYRIEITDLYYKDGKPEGTRVTVLIPLVSGEHEDDNSYWG